MSDTKIPTDRAHIIYFTAKDEVTEVDRKAISKISATGPCFITIKPVSAFANDACDGVAGAVPDSMKDKLTAEQAIADFKEPEAQQVAATPAEPKGKATKAFAPPVETVEAPKE